MKNIIKQAVKLLTVGLLAVGTWTGVARADANVANDTATIQVTITPNVDRSVTIDTQNVVLNLGLIDLNASTQTVQPATVTIGGNLTNTELDLTANITGGWTFEPTATSSTTDKLKAWVLFTGTATVAAPNRAGDDFDNTNDFLASNTSIFPGTRVGGASGNGAAFENGGGAFADMDALNPSSKRHMWMYFTTPDVSSTAADQFIRFYLTVKAGS